MKITHALARGNFRFNSKNVKKENRVRLSDENGSKKDGNYANNEEKRTKMDVLISQTLAAAYAFASSLFSSLNYQKTDNNTIVFPL